MLTQIVLIMFQKLTLMQFSLHLFGAKTKIRLTATQEFYANTMFLKQFIIFALCVLFRVLMESLIYLILNLGFGIVFFFFGAAFILLYTPKEPGMKSYRICRGILGVSYLMMSIYACARIFIPQNNSDYGDFWFLVTFSLIFSWLNYTAFLFLINSERRITRAMIIDGAAPIIILLILGSIGKIFPATQAGLRITFSLIYALKCTWMYIKCMKEWNICRNDEKRPEINSLNIKWMRVLLTVVFIYSLIALSAFYFPVMDVVIGPMMVGLASYQTFKIINFMPKRLASVRSVEIKVHNTAKSERSIELADKIGPKIDAWVEQKKFCRPDITIKDAAQEIGTNHSYLSAYINGQLDMTFQVWLNTLRIEEAKKLLLEDHRMSIEEIGVQVGIPQGYNFSRWFKTITEMTPYQYRRSNAIKA